MPIAPTKDAASRSGYFFTYRQYIRETSPGLAHFLSAASDISPTLAHSHTLSYNDVMRILGIETSCDETAVCLIEATGVFGPNFTFNILGNALSSQAALHAQVCGV